MRRVCASALLKSDVKSAARGPGVRGIGGWGGGEGEVGWWDILERRGGGWGGGGRWKVEDR